MIIISALRQYLVELIQIWSLHSLAWSASVVAFILVAFLHNFWVQKIYIYIYLLSLFHLICIIRIAVPF